MSKLNCLVSIAVVQIVLLICPRIAMGTEVEDVVFKSHGVQLSGSIVFPKKEPIVSSVVFVHGSGKQKRNLGLARWFASKGIAALVYDKRGTGKSEGTYVQGENVSEKNLNLLADDAVAAIEVLHEHPKLNGIPAGYVGVSQAGWIIPLAAEKSSIPKYIALWSGPVCKVSEEFMLSLFTKDKDYENLDGVPDFKFIEEEVKEQFVWPENFGKDIDPSDSLANLSIPGLWIYGGKDGSIPVDLSISRLTLLINEGQKNYEYSLFPNLGHNNIDSTFSTMTSWIKKIVNEE